MTTCRAICSSISISATVPSVKAAFAAAAHRTRLELRNTRLVCNPMEPRAAVARYDGDTGYTLDVCSQGVVNLKSQLVNDILPGGEKVRVLTGNVGGSFGMKFSIYPEYICQLHAARVLGRPVKWTDLALRLVHVGPARARP